MIVGEEFPLVKECAGRSMIEGKFRMEVEAMAAVALTLVPSHESDKWALKDGGT